jgi:hypothetical protein
VVADSAAYEGMLFVGSIVNLALIPLLDDIDLGLGML